MQATAVRPSGQAETQRWRSVEGVLTLAVVDRDGGGGGRCGPVQLSEGMRVRVLAGVVEALQACDDNTLLTLLSCLRREP